MSVDQTPVVVITGASSGIGRITALAFARQGACLALAARDQAPLAAVAEECRALGGQVVIQPLDVRDFAAVDELRRTAVAAFGCIDVWVNCAAVLLFGRFEDLPPEAFRQVIETNVIGYANGARAAILQFRTQGDRGTLINVGSVLGMVGEPYVSAYVTSKFALRGLTACLRQEIQPFPNIHVCAVLPSALDTPIYQRAGNYMGREARSIAPVYDPGKAAEAIVRLASRPRPQVIVTGFGLLIALASKVAPGLLEWAVGRAAPRLQFKEDVTAASPGSLYKSSVEHAERGGWRAYWWKKLFLSR